MKMATNISRGAPRFAYDYQNLLADILEAGHDQFNQRTNSTVRTLHGARILRYVSDTRYPLTVPTPGNRLVRPHVSAAEALWMLRGDPDVSWLRRHTKIWNSWANDDDSMKDGTIAYGWRLRSLFARDQLLLAVLGLMSDRTSRQVYLSLWDPAKDGLTSSPDLRFANLPCPVGFVMNIVDARLHLSVHMRSSDVFIGLPYDVMTFTFVGHILAECLRCELGSVSLTLANAHVYEQQFSDLANSVATYNSTPFPHGLTFVREYMPSAMHLFHDDNACDKFVNHVREYFEQDEERICGTTYDPKPKVVV